MGTGPHFPPIHTIFPSIMYDAKSEQTESYPFLGKSEIICKNVLAFSFFLANSLPIEPLKSALFPTEATNIGLWTPQILQPQYKR